MTIRLEKIGSNQTVLHLKEVQVLFSYETPVAYRSKVSSTAYVTEEHYSRTTTKHINAFVKHVTKVHKVVQEAINEKLDLDN